MELQLLLMQLTAATLAALEAVAAWQHCCVSVWQDEASRTSAPGCFGCLDDACGALVT
jgi:hypothetical protein